MAGGTYAYDPETGKRVGVPKQAATPGAKYVYNPETAGMKGDRPSKVGGSSHT